MQTLQQGRSRTGALVQQCDCCLQPNASYRFFGARDYVVTGVCFTNCRVQPNTHIFLGFDRASFCCKRYRKNQLGLFPAITPPLFQQQYNNKTDDTHARSSPACPGSRWALLRSLGQSSRACYCYHFTTKSTKQKACMHPSLPITSREGLFLQVGYSTHFSGAGAESLKICCSSHSRVELELGCSFVLVCTQHIPYRA